MAPTDAKEKNRNIGAQLQSFLYTTARKRFWKTPHFRTYSRRTLFDLAQTLHDFRAPRANHKRLDPFFDLIHSFSARGQNVDFWLLSKNNTGRLPLRGSLLVIILVRRRSCMCVVCRCVRFYRRRKTCLKLFSLLARFREVIVCLTLMHVMLSLPSANADFSNCGFVLELGPTLFLCQTSEAAKAG